MTGIKRKAIETMEIPSNILNSVLDCRSSKDAEKDTIRKIIQRSRNDTRTDPPQLPHPASIIILDAYRMYISTGDWSNNMEILYVEGTFILAPALFTDIRHHGRQEDSCYRLCMLCYQTKKEKLTDECLKPLNIMNPFED
ncbi:hypothetical protein CHS0354_007937 [Potamilus streckersoni]|uniref:Uncharacterized protein n=1 Tax=Potamilus streckersoni TaxID=2493646 RepID=A0AAE0VRL5_9BIVA|nr:hypothetical protein CHS0354_007937 [Potamilus streckersoni]